MSFGIPEIKNSHQIPHSGSRPGSGLHPWLFKTNFRVVKLQVQPTFDIAQVWKESSKQLRRKTDAERSSIFVDAGILSPKGNGRKPFREVIVPMKSVSQ